MTPVSRPCSTFSRSLRCRPRQIRLVAQEHQRREHEDQQPQRERDVVDRQPELDRDDVVATADPQQEVERDRHDAEAGADRHVARPVEQVVLPLVAGRPRLDPRVDDQQPW